MCIFSAEHEALFEELSYLVTIVVQVFATPHSGFILYDIFFISEAMALKLFFLLIDGAPNALKSIRRLA